MISRLHELYNSKIVPEMISEFSYKNVWQVPKIKKVTVNMRISDASKDRSMLEAAMSELAKITGQKPIVAKAKKSVSNFSIRKGDAIGCRVTLRRERMYEFLDRLINITLPRIRDFNGLKTNSFDGYGNYSLGLSDQAVFPELDYDEVKRLQGMDITITIGSTSDKESLTLLRMFGIPFKKQRNDT